MNVYVRTPMRITLIFWPFAVFFQIRILRNAYSYLLFAARQCSELLTAVLKNLCFYCCYVLFSDCTKQKRRKGLGLLIVDYRLLRTYYVIITNNKHLNVYSIYYHNKIKKLQIMKCSPRRNRTRNLWLSPMLYP